MRGDRRARALLWALALSLLIGVLELGAPLEDYARAGRNLVRTHPPSGEIFVAGINDESSATLGEWPWPRRVQAQLIDKLKDGGARRIVYDVLFTTRSTPDDDRLFADSLKRAGNVWLEATDTYDPLTRAGTGQVPLPIFRQHAGVVSTKIKYNNLGHIRTLAYRPQAIGGDFPSMSAVLARVDAPKGETFRVDYAIDLSKVPSANVSGILDGSVPASAFRGKDVVVAFSRTTTDRYSVPWRGLVNGAYVLIAGAETLKAGPQTDLGWLVPLIVALFAAAGFVIAPRGWPTRGIAVAALLGFTVLPVLAEDARIYFDFMPALTLFGWVFGWRAWSELRQSYKVRGDLNPISGLPNLNALRGERVADDAVLVGARVRSYAEISSALVPEDERALVAQITGRLALGAAGARIYQGDEGIFMWVATPETSGGEHLDALHALFNSPALLDRRSIDLSLTFGIDAVGGRDLANRIGATLVAADEATAEGRRWKSYDPTTLAETEWRLSLLGRLDTAIDTGEIWVAYQPQLDVATGRISGAEALVRWSHPEKGEISPMEFVLAAEQHNRIEKLTQFVLRDAIRVAAEINGRGIPFDIAVNLSARLLEKPGLTTMVRAMLAEARLDPERLTLEVTESAAMTSGRASIRTLEELGSIGISISIDDYGTGFSTLEYFKLIPAAEVKIDKSFIAAIDRNASDRLMVRSTIELAHSLGRSVVAEGVETPEVLAELTKLGCDKIQGYLIGKPMKAPLLNGLIQERAEAHAA